MLTVLDHIPDGFLNASAESLHKVLPGPTLMHLGGRKPEPLFVSVLLHGNEYTGLTAIQQLLGRYLNSVLPRAISIFVGNVQAAARGLRCLDGQPDYNRVWPGAEQANGHVTTREHAMMTQVVEEMRERRAFASIDVHNNTGINPHYGCINTLRPEFLHLATLFSHTVVYFLRPLGVQSAAFANICPSTTIECGKPGDASAVAHTTEFIEAVLKLDHFPSRPITAQSANLFHTVAVVKIQDNVSFHFGSKTADVQLDAKIDHLNFREIEPGTRFGHIAPDARMPLVAQDETGLDVTDRYFEIRNGEILVTRRTMPSMLTLDERIIRQDCLCYLMERIAIPDSRHYAD